MRLSATVQFLLNVDFLTQTQRLQGLVALPDNRSQIGTLVERTTLYVALVKLDNGAVQATADGFGTILQRFDGDIRRSLTYDQGREMAQHAKLTEETGIKV